MAMIAPMKKVLSPISQTRIMAKLFRNAGQKAAVKNLIGYCTVTESVVEILAQ